TYTVTDLCDSGTDVAVFKVTPAPSLEISSPSDVTSAACDYADQTALDMAFADWLSGFTVSGGCDPQESGITGLSAPDACTGGEVMVTYSVTDKCDQGSAMAKFTVTAAPIVAVSCPTPVMLPADATAQDIQDAYDTWKAGFTVSGGCSDRTDNLAAIPDLPPFICGNSVNLSFQLTASDRCSDAMCSSSFMVEGAEVLEVTCPEDPNLDSCATADEILAAYNTWKAGFSNSGGINAMDNLADVPELPTYVCGAGVDLAFDYVVTDACGTASCSASFTVSPAPALELEGSCPGDPELDGCSDQATIDAAWTSWIQGLQAISATGGCAPMVSYSTPLDELVKPTQCSTTAQQVSIMISAVDACDASTSAITCTFTVAPYADDLMISDVQSVTASSCDYEDQAALDMAFADWLSGFSFSGGCDPQATDLSDLSAPDLCTGGSVNVTYTVTDLCDSGTDVAVFKLSPAASIVVSCPEPVSLNSPISQADIQNAYDTWVNAFTFEGGCDAISNIELVPELPAYECGEAISLEFTYTVYDDCDTTGKSCTSTFYVQETEPVDAGENGMLTICEGDIVTEEQLFDALEGNPDEGGVWSPTLAGAGVYTYTVSGTAPCPDDAATVTVSEEVVTITADEAVCDEAFDFGTYSVEINVNQGNVTADFGTVVFNGGISYSIIDIPNGQDVTITATTALGCSDQIMITAPECVCLEFDYEFTPVTCFGEDDGTITVTFVTPGATVLVNGQPYVEGQFYPPGDYSIEAFFEGVDDPSCTIKEDFEIVEPEPVDADVSWTNETCFDLDDGTITVSNLSEGAAYSIQKNGYGPDLSDQEFFSPGYYLVIIYVESEGPPYLVNESMTEEEFKQVRVEDPCVKSFLVKIEAASVSLQMIPLYGDEPICVDAFIKPNHIFAKYQAFGFSLNWTIDENAEANGWIISEENDNAEIAFIPGSGTAVFTLTFENEFGCSVSYDYEVESSCESELSSNQDEVEMMVYPNPAKNQLNIVFDRALKGTTTIELYDLLGNKSLNTSINQISRDKDYSYDISGLPSGVYYLKVSTPEGVKMRKIIVE
ncbi:MAG: T9SS type A sorting domain-containing protein, partial [bacterium]